MFTIKFYSEDGARQIIEEADSFTILSGMEDDDACAEITLHRKIGDDKRIDVRLKPFPKEGWPPVFYKAIIENSAGKTTEIIVAGRHPAGNLPPRV